MSSLTEEIRACVCNRRHILNRAILGKEEVWGGEWKLRGGKSYYCKVKGKETLCLAPGIEIIIKEKNERGKS